MIKVALGQTVSCDSCESNAARESDAALEALVAADGTRL
jgi:hypothetical protein